MTAEPHAILECVDTPLLLLHKDYVIFANEAATKLLGKHIVRQNVRLALRDPKVVALIQADEEGRVEMRGLSGPGSIWSVSHLRIDETTRIVKLENLSFEASVARAHADFVANASHELRTPLAAILGYVETLGEPKAGENEETRSRFLTTIKREAERMQRMIEDLMSLSRIQAGKYDAPSDRIDVVDLVRTIIDELSQDVTATMTTTHKLITVLGDRPQLAQTFHNLIDNAHKYGRAEDQIKIEIRLTESGMASISVHDEGEGIPPAHLPRITERFYRVDEGRSRAVGGTGLGLAIVKHIVERHRGRLDIRSAVGKGTTVTVLLPLIDAKSS